MCYIQKKFKNDPYDGIVNYFNNIPSLKVTDLIIAEGVSQRTWGLPSTIIDYSITGTSDSDQYASPDNQNQAYLILKFPFPIYITDYTFRTRTNEKHKNILQSWKIECSYYGKKYEQADSRFETKELYNDNFHTYHCQKPRSGVYIKITMTNTNTGGNWFFHLSRVEFFGKIGVFSSERNCFVTSNRIINLKLNYLFIIFIF